MKILVTGGTGNVGGVVVKELLKRGAKVRVLARKRPEQGKLPAGVEVAIGDMLDPGSVEQALQGVDKLFLLNAVVADELTQALIAYGSAIPRRTALCVEGGGGERAARVRCSVHDPAAGLLPPERRPAEGRPDGSRYLPHADWYGGDLRG